MKGQPKQKWVGRDLFPSLSKSAVYERGERRKKDQTGRSSDNRELRKSSVRQVEGSNPRQVMEAPTLSSHWLELSAKQADLI